MDGLIKLFKEVDGQTLFLAAIFVCVALAIIVEGIVKIVENRKK
jgi:hypothetical protein